MGAEDEAEEVLIAKARFAATGGSAAEFLWRYFLGPLIGFGYRPFRAFLAASLLIVLSAVFVRKARKSGLFVPREQASGAKPFGLNALVYSLDLFLPIVDLHQLRYWIPGGVADRTIARIGKAKITSGTLLRMLRLWFWFMILAGWLITTIFVLALAGVIRE